MKMIDTVRFLDEELQKKLQGGLILDYVAKYNDFHKKENSHFSYAWNYIRSNPNIEITKESIMLINGMIEYGELKPNMHRTRSVSIRNEDEVIFYPPGVDFYMEEYDKWLEDIKHLDYVPLYKVPEYGLRFCTIHPFFDKNGRTRVLIEQLLLYKAGLKCALILPIDEVEMSHKDQLMVAQIKSTRRFYGLPEFDPKYYTDYYFDIVIQCYKMCLEYSDCNQ